MIRRLGALGSAAALLASALVAVVTLGISAAQADSFEDWANVSAGGLHSCGVRKNGKLYCWGSDSSGQIGDGSDTTPDHAPHRIGTMLDWSSASAGYTHSCGIRHGGKLYCWGSDADGQIGDGGSNSDANAPRRIGDLADWNSVSAGDDHTCGIRKGGKLYCWGNDAYHQLGDGNDGTAATKPRRIGVHEDWANVSAGRYHTCGVRKIGKLYCWGNDGAGEIGDGDTPGYATTPRRIGDHQDWANVSAGILHSCGVRKIGKLYCWGSDGNDQIGDGDNPTTATSPRRIGDFLDWASASAGQYHSCGVRKNGKLYCWGGDGSGQVGDGLNFGPDPATAPRRIGDFLDWSSVDAGDFHSCGIRAGGKLYCWGGDTSGQVGDGDDDAQPALKPRRI
jgi:alpha-tubulin suppressor-like RCC1 family protein